MSKVWLTLLVTIVVGVAAFFIGPQLWPFGHDVPMPPLGLRPLYMALSAIEALAFGFAVAFGIFGWSAIRDLQLGARWLNGMLFVTLLWSLGNWWIHDNLHMHIGLDMSRLIYIEYGFHLTLLACPLVLAVSLMRIARRAGSR